MSAAYFCAALAIALHPLAAQSITVAAAADLAPLEKPLARAFLQATSLRVQFAFGSSGMLAQQVASGAPYDVYLSANEKFVEDLAASNHVLKDSMRLYATGRLGLWSLDTRVRTLDELRGREFIAIPNPRHAPYGAAARQLLENKGLWAKLEPRLVLGENVRQAFEYARTGNAGAVITSWTLLHDKGGVLLPQDHAPLRQAGAVVTGSKHEAAARRFLDFLVSDAGRKVLLASGLLPP